jgi:hypothetical protein
LETGGASLLIRILLAGPVNPFFFSGALVADRAITAESIDVGYQYFIG